MVYRNHELLALARLAPHCMGCGKRNQGDVVPAHSNQGRDGKGTSIKASDAAVAFLCTIPCHVFVDQGKGPIEERTELWERGHRATMRWLIESGHLVVSVIPQPPPAPKPKPKKAMPKGRKLQSAPFPKSERKHEWPKRSFQKRREK